MHGGARIGATVEEPRDPRATRDDLRISRFTVSCDFDDLASMLSAQICQKRIE